MNCLAADFDLLAFLSDKMTAYWFWAFASVDPELYDSLFDVVFKSVGSDILRDLSK